MATKTYEEALKEQQKKTAELQKKLTTAVKNDEASKARYMGDIQREYNAINAGTYTPRFTNPSANRRPENSSVVRNNQYKAGSTSSLPSASSTVKIQNVSSFGTRGTSLQQVDNDDSFAAYQRVLNAQNRNTAGEKTVLDYYQNRVNGGHTPTEEEIRYAGAVAALIDEEREKGATEVDIVQLMNRAKAQEAARKQAEYDALSPAKKLVHDFEEVKQSSDYNRRVQQGKGLFETSPLGAPDLSGIPVEYRDYYYYLLSGSAQDVYKAQELLTYLQNTEQYEQENNPVGYYEDFAKKVSALKSRGDYDAVTQEGRAKTGGMIGDYATVDAMRNDPQRASTIDKGRRLLGEYADSRTANLTPEARDYYYWLIGSDMYGIANNILSNAQNADYYLETNNMTAEERNIYFAFVGAGDNENATKYLNSIKEQANMRRGENLSKQVENMVPGLRGAAAGALGVAGGVANVVSGIANAASMVTGNVMQQFTDADGFDKIILVPRDDLEYTANMLNSSESLSKLGRMVANIGYQAGRMIPSVAVSAVAGAAGAPALATRLASIAPSFASLYGTTYGDALRNGDSNAQAAAYSLLNAVLETGLQYALGSIPGVSSGSGVLQNAVKNVGTRLAQHPGVMTALRVLANAGDEGLEEFLQEIIDPLARNIATGENNRLDAQTLENAAYSFLLGSLTGFLFEAPNISGEFADASVDAINAKMDTLKSNAYLTKLKGIEPIAADSASSQFAGAGTQSLGDRFRDRVQAAAPMQSVEALERYVGNAAQSAPAEQTPTVMPQPQNAPVSEISPVAQGAGAIPTAAAPAVQPKTQNDNQTSRGKLFESKAVTRFVQSVDNALGMIGATNRSRIRPYVQELAESIRTDGTVDQTKADAIFERAYSEAVAEDAQFYDQYKDLKDTIRSRKLYINKADVDSNTWRSFIKGNFGTVTFTTNPNAGALPVDTAYQELQAMYPGLFPDVIASEEMAQQIAEVGKSIRKVEMSLEQLNGQNAAAHKKDAKFEFDRALERLAQDVGDVTRYNQARNEMQANRTPQVRKMTREEARQVYRDRYIAKKNAEKAARNILLTPLEEDLVQSILKGNQKMDEAFTSRRDANVNNVLAAVNARAEVARLDKLVSDHKAAIKQERAKWAQDFIANSANWKSPKTGLELSRETPYRNAKAVMTPEDAQRFIDEVLYHIRVNAALMKQMRNDLAKRINDLKLSRKKQYELTESQWKGEGEMPTHRISESGLVQLYGEKLIDDTALVQMGADVEKIQKAAGVFREIYDQIFDLVDEVRIDNGYDPVGRIENYFPHFDNENDFLTQFVKFFGAEPVRDLPAEIAGKTAQRKPGTRYSGHLQQRTGDTTSYDALDGFEGYIGPVLDIIYHTDDIQKVRSIANALRYKYASKTVRERVDAVRNDPQLTAETKESEISKIYEEAKENRNELSNYVVYLDEYANILAGKQSSADRWWESQLGRSKWLSLGNWLGGQAGKNYVTMNVVSALTNTIPFTQAASTTPAQHMIKGAGDAIRNIIKPDGIWEHSVFLQNRRDNTAVNRNWMTKTADALGWINGAIDHFTSEAIVRAKYYQAKAENPNISDDQAMRYADDYAMGVITERSKESLPTIMAAKNPIAKAVLQFQTEVNNNISFLLKDVPEDAKQHGKSVAMAYIKMFLAAYMFNDVFEKLFGRRAATDPIDWINQFAGDAFGVEIPNIFDVGSDRGKMKKKAEGVDEAFANLFINAASELPVLGSMVGDGGRLPIEGILPDASAVKGVFSEGGLRDLGEELLTNTVPMLSPFGGGSQIKKTIQGIGAFARGGIYGEHDGEEYLKAPIDQNFLNLFRVGVAGRWADDNAREYIDSGFKSLSAKETQVYDFLVNDGASSSDAWHILKDLKAIPDKEDKDDSKKLKIIADSKLDTVSKEFLQNFIVSGESFSFDYDSQKYELEGEALSNFWNTKGGIMNEMQSAWEDFAPYQKFTDKQKKSALDYARQYGQELAKDQYLGDEYELDGWVKDAYWAYRNDPEMLAIYIAARVAAADYKNSSMYDKDEYLSAARTKKALVNKVTEGLTNAERRKMYDLLGISEKVW